MINYLILVFRQSPVSERKRDARSRSISNPPPEKRVPVWEADADQPPPPPPSYKAKPPEMPDSSYPSKKRIPESSEGFRDSRSDDTKEQNYPSYQNRYDKYQNRERPGDSYRQDGYDRTRFDQDRYQGPNMRRQFNPRGGYRNQQFRNSEHYGDSSTSRYRDSNYGDGPNRYREPGYGRQDYGDGPSGRYRDSEQDYSDGPPGRYRESGYGQQDYSKGPARYRDSEQNYGDGPPGRYRDADDYGDGPSGRFRNSQNYGDEREPNNYRNKVKLVDY